MTGDLTLYTLVPVLVYIACVRVCVAHRNTGTPELLKNEKHKLSHTGTTRLRVEYSAILVYVLVLYI